MCGGIEEGEREREGRREWEREGERVGERGVHHGLLSQPALQGLKCRLNPSLEEADKRTIECSLYVPPQEDGEGQGKLWLGLVSVCECVNVCV